MKPPQAHSKFQFTYIFNYSTGIVSKNLEAAYNNIRWPLPVLVGICNSIRNTYDLGIYLGNKITISTQILDTLISNYLIMYRLGCSLFRSNYFVTHYLIQNMTSDFVRFTKIYTNCSPILNTRAI